MMQVMTKHERYLQLFLRVIGGAALLALPCVALPYTWMDATHQWLGLGKLPADPIVGYLARSISAFYALLGGLLWTLSFDLRRHRFVLRYLGGAITFFGLILFAVDWLEGLPPFWALWEGPLDAAFGVIILYLTRHIIENDHESQPNI